MELEQFDVKHNHGFTDAINYRKPKEPAVRAAIKEFSAEKFGLMMHWGIYSTLGIIESWALPDADRGWAVKDNDKYVNMSGKEFRAAYWGQIAAFNPTSFQPQKWAKAAKKAGFKYMVFTTKHHDGFCMWDTKYTDFKVTSEKCPYSASDNADICRHLFDAFRAEGIKIHAYFSKPDWHSEYYWEKDKIESGKTDRMTTYNPLLWRKLWKAFRSFACGQLTELVRDYGKIDCLWLDGGQVRPSNGMDLKLSAFMREARKYNPALMVADRTVGGKNENFITPEQTVPDRVISVPWESCVTLGETFAYSPNDKYKSATEVIALLMDVISKGGNLALNIAPDSTGDFPAAVYPILADIGAWLKRNGYAVYGTKPISPYRRGRFAFTAKDGEVYAVRIADKPEKLPKPLVIPWTGKVTKVVFDGKSVPFKQAEDGILIEIDSDYDTESAYVFTLK